MIDVFRDRLEFGTSNTVKRVVFIMFTESSNSVVWNVLWLIV